MVTGAAAVTAGDYGTGIRDDPAGASESRPSHAGLPKRQGLILKIQIQHPDFT
jgi:hypothetical protein